MGIIIAFGSQVSLEVRTRGGGVVGATTTKLTINLVAACPQLCGELQVTKRQPVWQGIVNMFLFGKNKTKSQFLLLLWYFVSDQKIKSKTINQCGMAASIVVTSPHKRPQKHSHHSANRQGGGGHMASPQLCGKTQVKKGQKQ